MADMSYDSQPLHPVFISIFFITGENCGILKISAHAPTSNRPPALLRLSTEYFDKIPNSSNSNEHYAVFNDSVFRLSFSRRPDRCHDVD